MSTASGVACVGFEGSGAEAPDDGVTTRDDAREVTRTEPQAWRGFDAGLSPVFAKPPRYTILHGGDLSACNWAPQGWTAQPSFAPLSPACTYTWHSITTPPDLDLLTRNFGVAAANLVATPCGEDECGPGHGVERARAAVISVTDVYERTCDCWPVGFVDGSTVRLVIPKGFPRDASNAVEVFGSDPDAGIGKTRIRVSGASATARLIEATLNAPMATLVLYAAL